MESNNDDEYVVVVSTLVISIFALTWYGRRKGLVCHESHTTIEINDAQTIFQE